VAGGALTVIIWDYLPMVQVYDNASANSLTMTTLSGATGLYSLAVGFAVSLALIIIVSLCTKAPDEEIVKEFDEVNAIKA